MKKQLLLALSIFILSSCAAKQEPVESNDYKAKSKIAMQRVKDTAPLAKQDLVSREAMQYAMLDKMNVREDRQRREFNRIQKQQRNDFLDLNVRNTKKMDAIRENIITSNDEFVEITELTQKKVDVTLDQLMQDHKETKSTFKMLANKIDDATQMQSRHFMDMKTSYENKLAFEEAKIARERERENTIRGVVENMYADQGTALKQFYATTKEGMLPPSQWVALEDSPIALHVENEKFEDLILRALNNAAINSGPWNLKWKLKRENENLLYTKFSLDAEVKFGEFLNNVKSYVINYNGVRLYFRVFKEKRVLIVSDS